MAKLNIQGQKSGTKLFLNFVDEDGNSLKTLKEIQKPLQEFASKVSEDVTIDVFQNQNSPEEMVVMIKL